jgi:hypothetical protein
MFPCPPFLIQALKLCLEPVEEKEKINACADPVIAGALD